MTDSPVFATSRELGASWIVSGILMVGPSAISNLHGADSTSSSGPHMSCPRRSGLIAAVPWAPSIASC